MMFLSHLKVIVVRVASGVRTCWRLALLPKMYCCANRFLSDSSCVLNNRRYYPDVRLTVDRDADNVYFVFVCVPCPAALLTPSRGGQGFFGSTDGLRGNP